MKYFGMVLIFIGVGVVFFAMFFAVQVFLQEKEPPQIFTPQETLLSDLMPDMPTEEETNNNEEELLIAENIKIEDILPISELLNIIAASMFAMILVFGGAKITQLGVSIIRERE